MRGVACVNSKGGTGKSIVALNLAAELVRRGHRVALADVDLDNPNVMTLLGLKGITMKLDEDRKMVPIVYNGMKVFSLDLFFGREGLGLTMSGREKHQIISDALKQTDWGDCDFFVIDSPGGTGEEFRAVSKLGNDLLGMVVVTQPNIIQPVRRIIDLCTRYSIRVLGVIENMSGFSCPHCGGRIAPFGEGDAEKFASQVGARFFGFIPLLPTIKDNPFIPDGHLNAIKAVADYIEEL